MHPVASVLVVSPRYADDVAAAVDAAGFSPIAERRPEHAPVRMDDERRHGEAVRLVVVDARGALTQGLAAARALDANVKARLGAMLVLLSRSDGEAAAAAYDAGATAVLISPFSHAVLGNSLRLAVRHAERLTDAAVLVDSGQAAMPGVDGDAAAMGEAERTDRRARDGARDGANDRAGDRDPLTGLATGAALERWLTGLLAPPEPPEIFVIALGLGRLAPINAAYGRDVADRVLCAVAERLQQAMAGRDLRSAMLTRLAAAEFAVGVALPRRRSAPNNGEYMNGGHMNGVTALAASLAEALRLPFVIGDHVIHLSGRAGIAEMMLDGPMLAAERATTLVRRAAAALNQARSRESGAVVVFEPDPAGDPMTRMADLEADLHRAIDNQGINLLYQPQLALLGGGIVAVEALVRWEHPVLGTLPAETVLETAASAELAVRLGRHIRARAMMEAASWRGPLSGLSLSVNVTAADLADPRFEAALELAIGNSGLARDRLVLEVTEGALIDDVRGAARMLETLRATGVRVALDDFGTGFSSLAWLARLPIDTIKLDRSFMLGLTASERERMVVETVVGLSKRLGLSVVAEGVENDLQMAAARRAGADMVQGYRVAPPLDVAALATFVAGWGRAAVAG